MLLVSLAVDGRDFYAAMLAQWAGAGAGATCYCCSALVSAQQGPSKSLYRVCDKRGSIDMLKPALLVDILMAH